MKTPYLHSFRTWSAVCAVTLTLGVAPTVLGEDLGEVLRECGWNRIIGTWVDQDTDGERIRISYSWKFKDKVIKSDSKMGDIQSSSLIVRNPKTGEILQLAANNRGGGGMGKWSIEDGDAVLDFSFISEDGDEGDMTIRHHLKDNKTMTVTIETPEPVTISLKRVKRTPKAAGAKAKAAKPKAKASEAKP